MAGLIKFTLFCAVLLAVLVLVVVPLVTGPIITSALRDAGLDDEDVTVSVDFFGPSLLTGRAPAVHLQAQDVAVPHGVIGRVDLTLHEVGVSDRSFRSVTGHLEDIVVTGPGGVPFTVDSVELEGPAEATRARGRIGSDSATRLMEQVAREAGVPVDRVRLRDDGLVIEHGGTSVDVDLRVDGDALILDRPGAPPTVLLSPAPSESWRLEDVRVSEDGLRLDLTVDARELADEVAGRATVAP